MRATWLVFRPHGWPISFRIDRRVPSVILVLSLVTLTVMAISLGQGDYPVSPLDVVKTILGLPTGNDYHDLIVNTLRLPRMLVAWAVGAGLAIAGTLTQGMTRNPLAAPGIIGVSAGASLAAITLLIVFPGISATYVPLAAFSGALIVALLIYLLAWQDGNSPTRLILVGVAFSLIAGALVLITFGAIYDVSRALTWLAGSVYGRSWDDLYALLPWLIIFGGLAGLQSRALNTIQLGDDIARSLGNRLPWQQGWLLLTSAALAGAAVATAGNVTFVGLMAPHIARQWVGPSHEGSIPVAALTGGLLMVIADSIGRTAFSPLDIPCGVFTAIIGAPYFLYLLIRSRLL